MYEIFRNDLVIAYEDDTRKFSAYLPSEEMISFKTHGKQRTLKYPSGIYVIKPTNKVKGIYEGNICPVCSMGTMVDMAGCMTCNNCMTQLKCGL